ncbi:hypothetical protein JQC91_15530 [Jannaschia sp. Os4]|uniref:hypothetical protein n=1 Tax=Jannaschia sp. Os4 TaxID=2807617 RepID=UPI0019395A84|nr:hypothetical protein [Jannaschia sp. Os4]MBM2577718.1 hypothetical protein [Jannaschia sp. Os4]
MERIEITWRTGKFTTLLTLEGGIVVERTSTFLVPASTTQVGLGAGTADGPSWLEGTSTTTYDGTTGIELSTLTAWPDGTTVTRTPLDPVASSVEVLDAAGTEDWDRRIEHFLADGTLHRVEVHADDGRVYVEGYDWNGVLGTYREADVTGAEDWIERSVEYGADGSERLRYELSDDLFYTGRQTRSDGAFAEFTNDYGDLMPWASVYVERAGDGSLRIRAREGDDGIERTWIHDEGGLTQRLVHDGDDIRSWDRIEIDYADGEEVLRRIVRDNGIVEERSREVDAGGRVLERVARTDAADEFAFAEVVTLRDAADRLVETSRVTDSGYEVQRFYEDGLLARTVRIDHADERDWAERVLIHDATGAVVERITTWDDAPLA